MINVLYEDNHLLCVEKPVNVPVMEDDSKDEDLLSLCKAYLKEKYNKPGNVYCGLVHRLDRPVGGVMVYALDRDSAAALSRQIGDGRFEKEYLAVIHGEMNEAEAELRDLLFHDRARNKSYAVTRKRAGVKEAVLDYRALQAAGACSLLSVRLRTGRTHQIRVQFASRGHPLVGDAKYGSPRRDCPVALYSHRLAFAHPVTDEVLSFTAPPPGGYPWSLFSI